ncbi:MAG: T9SS type A sorting domain-containing protein [Fibrobacteres bacterium]|nr:T9SS type A sorting domain-containing protein [Fibrobacterota bacterium]
MNIKKNHLIILFLSFLALDPLASISDSIIWTEQSKGGGTLWGVHFIDSLQGFAFGDGGTMYKTVNGGMNWINNRLSSSDTIYGMHFVNCSTGFLCTGSGRIYKTTDTARTWTQNYFRTGWLSGISFWNKDTGWAVGSSKRIPYSIYNAVVYSTKNGGVSWDSSAISGPYSLKSVQSLNGKAVYVCGFNYLAISQNSGASWNTATSYTGISDPQFQNSNGYINIAAFVSPTNGLAVGRYGHIMRTQNGGASWSSARINDFTWLQDVKYIDSLRAVVVGERGVVFSSTDGGTTWSKRYPRHTSSTNAPWFRALYTINSANMWMVGDSGIIMKGRFFSHTTAAELNTKKNNTDALNILSAYSVSQNDVCVKYHTNASSKLILVIYDVSGRTVFNKSINTQTAGSGYIGLKPKKKLSTGTYYLRMISEKKIIATKRFIVIK